MPRFRTAGSKEKNLSDRTSFIEVGWDCFIGFQGIWIWPKGLPELKSHFKTTHDALKYIGADKMVFDRDMQDYITSQKYTLEIAPGKVKASKPGCSISGRTIKEVFERVEKYSNLDKH